jgi:hypothetical protein
MGAFYLEHMEAVPSHEGTVALRATDHAEAIWPLLGRQHDET